MEQYKSFKEHLEQAEGLQPINEILMTLIAGSILAWTCAPLLNTDFMKNIGAGLGATLASLGNLFGLGGKKDSKDKGENDKGENDKGEKRGNDKGDEDNTKTKTPSTKNKPSESDPNDDLGEIVPGALGAAAASGDDKAKAASQDVMSILMNPDGTMKKLPLSEEDQKKLNDVAEKHNIEKIKSAEDFEKAGKKVNDDLKTAAQKDPDFLKKAAEQTASMKVEAATDAQKKEQEDIEKEYKEKIENESDPDKKKALEKERDEKIEASKKKLQEAKEKIEKEKQETIELAKKNQDTNTDPNPEPKDDTKKDTNTDPKPEPKKETTADKIQKQLDGHKENKQKLETEIKELEKKAEKSGGDVKKKIEKQISGKKEQIKAVDKKIEGAEKALAKAKQTGGGEPKQEPKEETFKVTHNGQETEVCRRPAEGGNAKHPFVYYFKNDPEKKAQDFDTYNALYRKSKGGSTNESLSDWLGWWCISL